MKTKVTILCMTYNQVNYITQALDSLICQKTNFPFEIIIHDDASTDGTREIIEKYEKKYPNIIKAIYQNENQFSKGKDILTDFMIDYIQGEYVAINEGDDFWIDKNKLQRQVDFLDRHHDFSICFHPVKVIWEDNSEPETIFPSPKCRFHKKVLNLNDLLKHNFIQTNSVMYRWCLTKEMWSKRRILPCDYMWHLLHAQKGKIGFIPNIMSVYRRNKNGIWTGSMKSDEWFLKCGIPCIRFYEELENKFGCNKRKDKIKIANKTIQVLLKKERYDIIKQIATEFKRDWNDFFLYDDILNSKIKKLRRENKQLCMLCLIFFIIELLLFLKG